MELNKTLTLSITLILLSTVSTSFGMKTETYEKIIMNHFPTKFEAFRNMKKASEDSSLRDLIKQPPFSKLEEISQKGIQKIDNYLNRLNNLKSSDGEKKHHNFYCLFLTPFGIETFSEKTCKICIKRYKHNEKLEEIKEEINKSIDEKSTPLDPESKLLKLLANEIELCQKRESTNQKISSIKRETINPEEEIIKRKNSQWITWSQTTSPFCRLFCCAKELCKLKIKKEVKANIEKI